MEKRNCWEVKKCEREPGGANVEELGVCVAATEAAVDGVHDGKNGGRACWALAGTLCGGQVQGTFAEKSALCPSCNFYKSTQTEEGARFLALVTILGRLYG